ncbi:preprotein translocase subunit YajC [Frankia sp. AgB1.9]|uniref:preprotein translocase subunit YajC n=1 Tax=unclassified Frankia TaxID=2632575 RepID=UPI0019332D5A|nr:MULTISPECIES: preprotein translocase subunit YajC [unclassified Frankia]MBL7488705.1 preprotein translocase subunit YajC [Frankia sp. AgW1.1]MBL7546813.1 preprotein translocase subunit YajC [Frankia sp. AgB1.9]MBL7621056.1 preprotein translocase subunit YajC [Frankia sp. AgB1.8]
MQPIAAAAIAANNEAASKSGGGFGSWLLPLLIVLVGVYFFTMQRRRQRATQSEQSKLGPGTLVMTRSGLYGTIVETDGEDILLEIAPDVVCRFNRGAIGRVISSPDTPGVPEEDTPVSFEKDAETPADETTADETPADEPAAAPEAPEASQPPKKEL